jgi:hypothetical protein
MAILWFLAVILSQSKDLWHDSFAKRNIMLGYSEIINEPLFLKEGLG